MGRFFTAEDMGIRAVLVPTSALWNSAAIHVSIFKAASDPLQTKDRGASYALTVLLRLVFSR